MARAVITGALSQQFVTFALIGLVGTAGHYAVLIALVQSGVTGPTVATTAGFAVGAVINYVLNYRFTFASSRPHLEALPRFLAVAATGAGLNYLVMRAGIDTFGLHYLLAQILATGVVLLWTFSINRLWTFKKKQGA